MRYRTLILAGCIAWTACKETAKDYYPAAVATSSAVRTVTEYRFGVPPMPPHELWDRYHALIDCLNSNVSGFGIRLESALDHSTYRGKIRNAEFDIALLEPHTVLEAEPLGYNVFARTGTDDRVSGLLIVRRDANIRRVRDLKGKTICFGAPDALASTMMVRVWLKSAGLKNGEAEIAFAGMQESALLEALSGTAHAAGASRIGWRRFLSQHPEAAEQLELKWRTQDLTGPALMAHKRVNPQHVRLLERTLTRIASTPCGASALARARISEFRPAVSGSYDDVWEFINAYTKAFPRERNSWR